MTGISELCSVTKYMTWFTISEMDNGHAVEIYLNLRFSSQSSADKIKTYFEYHAGSLNLLYLTWVGILKSVGHSSFVLC